MIAAEAMKFPAPPPYKMVDADALVEMLDEAEIDEALAVLAAAVERGDPRAGKLYFDVATVADLQKHDQLEHLAKRIRQIGPQRILYGSDAAFGGRSTPDREWGTSAGWCR